MVSTVIPNELDLVQEILAEAGRIRQNCRAGSPLSVAALHLSVHGLAGMVAELARLRLLDLARAEHERAGQASQARPDATAIPDRLRDAG